MRGLPSVPSSPRILFLSSSSCHSRPTLSTHITILLYGGYNFRFTLTEAFVPPSAQPRIVPAPLPVLSDLLDRGRSLASVISVFACSIWSSSFFIGVQEVFIGQTDAERPMSLATFQLCVFPASPPLESLPQQRHWKRSFFSCEFNLPPSFTRQVPRGLEHILLGLRVRAHSPPDRGSSHTKKRLGPRWEGGGRWKPLETHCYSLRFLSSPHSVGTDRILGAVV